MILGTGIDLLKISRVKKVLNKYGDLFVKKVFSDDEIKNNKKIISNLKKDLRIRPFLEKLYEPSKKKFNSQ